MNSKTIVIASTDISTGGLGSYIGTLLRGLNSRGWDVHLLVTNTRGEYFDEMKRNFHCHDLSTIPLSPKKAFMAADLIGSIMPGVILTNNCALMQYATPLIDPKIRTVPVLHSDDSRFYAIGALFSSRMFRWIAPTAGLAAQFRTYVNQRYHDRIRVIPHGIDGRRFFSREIGGKTSGFQILFVGFLGESKGAEMLPDIFQKVSAAIPASFLTIIGTGPLEAHLRETFKKRGLQDRVRLLGATTPDKTAETMRTSHALLLPTKREGFGIAIVEAIMCGAVPVVSRLTGITDQLVQDGETGLLVAPHDVEGFAEALKSIHRDGNRLEAMAAKGHEMAVKAFSVETMIDRYETLFAEHEERSGESKSSTAGWYAESAIEYLRKRLR